MTEKKDTFTPISGGVYKSIKSIVLYSYDEKHPSDMYVKEYVDNSIESGAIPAKNVTFDFIEKKDRYFMVVSNDGEPMSSDTFENTFCYYSGSTKENNPNVWGQHGLGSKLPLASYLNYEKDKPVECDLWCTNFNNRNNVKKQTARFYNTIRKIDGDDKWDISVIHPRNFDSSEIQKLEKLERLLELEDIEGGGVRHIIEWKGDFAKRHLRSVKQHTTTAIEKYYRYWLLTNPSTSIRVDGVRVVSRLQDLQEVDTCVNKEIKGIETEIKYYEIDDSDSAENGFGLITTNGKSLQSLAEVDKSKFSDGFLITLRKEDSKRMYCVVNANLKDYIDISKRKLHQDKHPIIRRWLNEMFKIVKASYALRYSKPVEAKTENSYNQLEINEFIIDAKESGLFKVCNLDPDVFDNLGMNVDEITAKARTDSPSVDSPIIGDLRTVDDDGVRKTDPKKTGKKRETGGKGIWKKYGRHEKGDLLGEGESSTPQTSQGYNPIKSVRREKFPTEAQDENGEIKQLTPKASRVDESGCSDGQKNIIINIGHEDYLSKQTNRERLMLERFIIAWRVVKVVSEFNGKTSWSNEEVEEINNSILKMQSRVVG